MCKKVENSASFTETGQNDISWKNSIWLQFLFGKMYLSPWVQVTQLNTESLSRIPEM